MTEVSHSHGPPAIKAVFQVPDTQYIRFPTYCNSQGNCSKHL